jgi:hypothetical protein
LAAQCSYASQLLLKHLPELVAAVLTVAAGMVVVAVMAVARERLFGSSFSDFGHSFISRLSTR